MTTTVPRTLAARPRRTWRAFLAASVLGLAAAVVVALAQGAERVGVTLTVFTGVVVIGVLAAVLDAVVTPGSPDVVGHRGHAAGGWAAGGVGVAGGGAGGADCGGGSADCG